MPTCTSESQFRESFFICGKVAIISEKFSQFEGLNHNKVIILHNYTAPPVFDNCNLYFTNVYHLV